MLLLQKNNVSPKSDVILGGKYDVDITEKMCFQKQMLFFWVNYGVAIIEK